MLGTVAMEVASGETLIEAFTEGLTDVAVMGVDTAIGSGVLILAFSRSTCFSSFSTIVCNSSAFSKSFLSIASSISFLTSLSFSTSSCAVSNNGLRSSSFSRKRW